MAIAAWSAKVSTTAICFVVNGLTSRQIYEQDAEQLIAFEDGHGENCPVRLDGCCSV